MKQILYVRSLLNGEEETLTLPMQEDDLNKELDRIGELIIVDYTGPYPVEEYDSIIQINNDVQKIAECQDAEEISEDIVELLYRESSVSATETTQKIIDGDFLVFDLDKETSGWLGTDECKAAIYLNHEKLVKIDEFCLIYKETDGVVPNELENYTDWDAVWGDCCLQHGWKIVYTDFGGIYKTLLLNIL